MLEPIEEAENLSKTELAKSGPVELTSEELKKQRAEKHEELAIIQIWLARAYEAHNRHRDCISLYKRLEASHPNKQIRHQASDLRYILEASKLKISKEEMVSIPIIERDYDRYCSS
ncbi:unnamed protein product [Calypogeia fissa]